MQAENDEILMHSLAPEPKLFSSFLGEIAMAMTFKWEELKLFIEFYLLCTSEILIVMVR